MLFCASVTTTIIRRTRKLKSYVGSVARKFIVRFEEYKLIYENDKLLPAFTVS